MPPQHHLDVVPALVGDGEFGTLLEQGQTISLSASPLSNALALFITPTTLNAKGSSGASEEQPIYFASIDKPPSSERRLFITDTLSIFTAFHAFLAATKEESPGLTQNDQTWTVLRKLAIDYVLFIKECWVHASQPIPRAEPLQFSSDHYRSLYTCFSLFVVLYVPPAGEEKAPFGDELLEWLNTHFIEPSTEEGHHLSGLDKPWEDETFWPYITRSILRGLTKASLFFLNGLSQHPADHLVLLSETLSALVESQPHFQNFSSERDFAYAYRRWNDKVKALRIDLDRVPEADRFDDFENWWERMSDIVGVLEGRAEVLKRVCDDLGADWKEVCVAWTIFVDPRLRREELPDIVASILSDFPPDPTSLEDNIHAYLFAGKLGEALEQAFELDPWLSAHMADIMQPLSLLERDVDDDCDVSQRDYYTLSYADYLQSDPALWRIVIAYMYSCGNIGRRRGDEVLLHIPLHLHEKASEPHAAEKIRAGELAGTLKDINEACLRYQREGVRRTVCKIAAQTFIEEKNFGLAASYCISAEDWFGLGHIVDHVLEEYVAHGSRPFMEYASAIAPILQTLGRQAGVSGVFFHRMIFAIRYAQLHELLTRDDFGEAAAALVAIFHEDVAPTAWWAVVLCDSVQLLEYQPKLLFTSANASLLLRKLEDVVAKVSQGASSDFLSLLARTMSGDEKAALQRLQVVRLALARYFARCTVLNV
ncbi:Nup85 nucleoporin-domain-containing protein [Coprinopsis sp. MPI-PUGE-AT-0042]|nr:Nup85 nucleoporin-domain-containing protein [Coprinopsis sp. MPI-PUGE-AT-0042]